MSIYNEFSERFQTHQFRSSRGQTITRIAELGELLSKGNLKTAGPFMSACVIVTQLVISLSAAWIGKQASIHGRKPLLLVGFGVLPVRGVLYTLTHATSLLIAIQFLDGVANAIFAIVSILVIKDRTKGTGRFNIAAGAMATMVGIGASVSNTIGGLLIQRFSFRVSFLGLSFIALLAFTLLWIAIPETLPERCPEGHEQCTSADSHTPFPEPDLSADSKQVESNRGSTI